MRDIDRRAPTPVALQDQAQRTLAIEVIDESPTRETFQAFQEYLSRDISWAQNPALKAYVESLTAGWKGRKARRNFAYNQNREIWQNPNGTQTPNGTVSYNRLRLPEPSTPSYWEPFLEVTVRRDDQENITSTSLEVTFNRNGRMIEKTQAARNRQNFSASTLRSLAHDNLRGAPPPSGWEDRTRDLGAMFAERQEGDITVAYTAFTDGNMRVHRSTGKPALADSPPPAIEA